MSWLKKDPSTTALAPQTRRLRVIASGTVFVTTTLHVPGFPHEQSDIRAQTVTRTRGGSAANILSALAQFEGVEASLVAPLGGSDEARALTKELERERVRTKYCKVWDNVGLPGAWIIHSEATNTHTVINHNPVPDLTHEDFVSSLGPLLAPENYYPYNYPATAPAPMPTAPSPRPSISSTMTGMPGHAPFDWIHFEGRSAKTTLNNMIGLDGLARERGWRDQCVFSLEVGRKSRQGVEALMSHADVIFFSKAYALSQSYSTPRHFLLSLVPRVASHALLIVHWGSTGSALLSVPTREYLQSSGWEDPRAPPLPASGHDRIDSISSGSGFWADGRNSGTTSERLRWDESSGHNDQEADSDDDRTEYGKRNGVVPSGVDDSATLDAFIGGMIFSLTRGLLPGQPWTPDFEIEPYASSPDWDKSKWRLEDCLRFATELAGRKAKQRGFQGLRAEMDRAGWTDI